jgi:hypothetical protein
MSNNLSDSLFWFAEDSGDRQLFQRERRQTAAGFKVLRTASQPPSGLASGRFLICYDRHRNRAG